MSAEEAKRMKRRLTTIFRPQVDIRPEDENDVVKDGDVGKNLGNFTNNTYVYNL